MKQISVKRIYEPYSERDGYRVLVDRVWPRGVSKKAARLNEWAREIAPSSELRKWFSHTPERFPEFVRRYRKELEDLQDRLEHLREIAAVSHLTLLYATRDPQVSHARVLADELNRK